ncbi:MAG: HEPN domain-containing protein [Spirochaetaceae bacterium]|nr:HEPN domain-containing protein [Spirochaetaceae bacterium]
MAERSADWFRQARRDLDSARAQVAAGFFEWACFISQQASEKALKAALQKLGAEAWGHSIVDLLRTLREQVDVPDELHASAVNLDRYYIPARYPNGWAAGSPADYFTEEDANAAIGHSQAILRFCEGVLAGPEPAEEPDQAGGEEPEPPA